MLSLVMKLLRRKLQGVKLINQNGGAPSTMAASRKEPELPPVSVAV